MSRTESRKVSADLRKIQDAKSPKRAYIAARQYPCLGTAAKCLAQDYANMFHFLKLASEIWLTTKTTNLLERALEGVIRRTKIMVGFKNRQSLESILFSVFYFFNQNQVLKFAQTPNGCHDCLDHSI
jgi:transposase-like protein